MGDLYQFDDERRARFSATVEGQLTELNAQAASVLDRTTPAPPGLPPAGSWIRAVKVDDDARVKMATPWHHVEGWDALIGCLSTRCRRRPGDQIRYGLQHYLGQAERRRLAWQRYQLLTSGTRPEEGACRQCDISLARDAARVERARLEVETAALVARLPAIDAIATDPAIDDAERGRRLRELWAPDVSRGTSEC